MKFLTQILLLYKSSLPKFLTTLSNEELRNWKLSIKLNLLLMVKIMYFSIPFGITFTLKLPFLKLSNSCVIRGNLGCKIQQEFYDLI